MGTARFEVEIQKKLAEVSAAALSIPIGESSSTVHARLASLQGKRAAYEEALRIHREIAKTDMEDPA